MHKCLKHLRNLYSISDTCESLNRKLNKILALEVEKEEREQEEKTENEQTTWRLQGRSDCTALNKTPMNEKFQECRTKKRGTQKVFPLPP